MSAPGPLGVTSRGGGVEFASAALDAGAQRLHRQLAVRANLARLGLGGLVLGALLVSLGAANTDALLPQSVRPVPSWLAGAFGSSGLHLGGGVLILLFTLMFASYVVAVHGSDRVSPKLVLMAIAAVHALVLLAPPLLSTDVFSYQAYARIWSVYGANPYLQGPHAIALDPLYPFIGAKWVTTPSAYGPLFTLLSYPTAHLSIAAGALSFKALAALANLVTAALVWNAARLRGRNPARAAALVALNPLVVVYGVGGAHNDLLMLTLMVAGIYALLAHRDRAAGALPILAGAVKITGVMFLPFMLASVGGLGARGRRRAIVLGAAVAAAGMLAIGLALFGSGQLHLFSTLRQQQSEGDWHSIPGFISTSLGLTSIGHMVGVALAVAFVGVFTWLLRAVWRGEKDWIDAAGWSAVALLIAAGSLLPWYVAWLMPFAALGSDRRLWRMSLIVTGLVSFLQLQAFLPHLGSLAGP